MELKIPEVKFCSFQKCKCGEPVSSGEKLCSKCKKEKYYYQSIKKDPENHLRRGGVGKRDWKCSLANFVDGARYVKFCSDWVKNDQKSSILFHGIPGSGKTHLAVSLCREILFLPGQKKFFFNPVIELLYNIRNTFSSNELGSLLKKYTDTDYLILDDLGSEKISQWTVETLIYLIGNRYRELKTTIITSELSVPEIADAESRSIASRISHGKVVHINLPDFRLRR